MIRWRNTRGHILDTNEKPENIAEMTRLGYERISSGGIVLPLQEQILIKKIKKAK